MKTTGSNSESAKLGGASLRPAVLTDFDDTAAEQNVAELLLQEFGDPTWQDVRTRFRAGEITLKEYQEITFRNILADKETMQNFAKAQANLRPHFGEMLSHCQQRDIPVAVVSQGLDFYIEAVLEKAGFAQLPVHSVSTTFNQDGIGYHDHHAYPGDEHRGNSKGLIVERYQQQGHHVVYIGDGRSDFEAAERADLVFAHKVLAEECQRQQIPFRTFVDFGDVLAALREHPLSG